MRHYLVVYKTLLFVLIFISPTASYGQEFAQIPLSKQEQQWLQKHPVIRLGYDGHFPPYSFINDHGELDGLTLEVFDIIEQKLGVQFQFHPETTWAPLYQAAQAKEVDIVATMVNRPERAQWFNFSEPYVQKSLIIITQAENQEITHRDALHNKTVALVKDYHYVTQILEKYPSITPHYVDTILDALNAVSIGEADAAITFLGAGHYYRTKYFLSNLKYAAIYDRNNAPESISVRNDWPELVPMINKALKSIPESKMQALRAKWLPANYEELLIEVELSEQEKQWIKENKNIRIGLDPEFAPFEYIENDQYSGMVSDYIRLLNQRLNLNMKVVKGISWEETVERAKRREIDVLPAVALTNERLKHFNFTESYLNFYRVIVTRNNAPMVFGLSDLENRKVAAQVNTSHQGYLIENSNIEPITYDTLQKSLLAVAGGEADAFVGDVASTTYLIRKLHLTNLKVAAPVSADIQNLHLAARKDWPQLIPILQKGLDSITPRQRKEISDKWLSVKYEPVINYMLIWKIVIPITILLGLVILWNVTLNRKVRQRTSELMYSAHYDQVTGLPNRFLIMDRFAQKIKKAILTQSKVAMISIDLDDFKKVNDSFSHSSGDKILKEVAERLQATAGDKEALGRLGGDQFLASYGPFNDITDVALVARNLLSIFQRTFSVDKREFLLNARVGISVYPDDGKSPDILLKNADSATHHAKNLGAGSYTFYTEKINLKVSRRMQLEEQMRSALKRNEFQVYYQPKVDSRTGQFVSFEALLRWFNKDLGEIEPSEFIEIAENNGLIVPIGGFVLKTAIEHLAIWQKRFNQPFSIAVNVSPIQFRSYTLLSQIESALNHAGLASEHLELEITEGALMDTSSNVENILQRIEYLGVKLAMDDYGTGYASMSNLRKYSFDSLKIDREFISDINDNASDQKMVSATIAMAHNLGLKVIAEGVETESQYQFLIDQNCDLLQGFLFSRPIPFEKMSHLLSATHLTVDNQSNKE